MITITNRPLIIFSISLIIGILIGKYINSYLYISLIVAIAVPIIFNFLKKHDSYKIILIGGTIFFLIGSISYIYQDSKISTKFSEFYEREVTIHGTVDSEPSIENQKISCIINTDEIESDDLAKKIHGKIILSTISEINNFEFGKKIILKGILIKPSSNTNPWGFNYKNYLSSSGISGSIFTTKESIKIYNEYNISLIKFGIYLRQKILSIINSVLPPNQAGLLAGILIGYRDGLSKEIQNEFSNAGLTHIMAVSGANVVFIILPITYILNKLRIKKIIINIVLIFVLCIFVLVTGFQPSVLRAVIMADIVLIGQILIRDAEVINSISLASILLLLYNPYTLFDIGFELSFVATISLIMFYKNIKKMIINKYLPDNIANLIACTLAAQIGVLPIIAYYFNKISIISLLSNLLVVPIIGLITTMGFVMVIVGFISVFLAGLIGYFNLALLTFILTITKYCAAIPYAVINVCTPSIILIIFYFFLIIYIFYARENINIHVKPKYLAITVMVYLGIAIVSWVLPKNLEIFFLDVGEGDSTFIDTYKHKKILIDGGGFKNYYTKDITMGDMVVIPFLFDYGTQNLDMIISSHPDDDHLAGLMSVLKTINVKNIVIPYTPDKTQYIELLKLAKQKKVNISYCSMGDSIKIDDKTKLDVLNPSNENGNTNELSLIFKLKYENISVLMTGDIPEKIEEKVIERNNDIKADILKVAHHGSKYSTCTKFLESVNPFAAIISVGKNNFGHPSEDTLKRLEDKNVKVFRTDENGAIILNSDGKKIKLKKMK